MTTFQGGTPPIESIASYRLYLWPSDVEVEFIDGKANPVNVQSMILNNARTPNTRPNQDQQRLPGQPYKPLFSKAPPYPYASGELVDFTVRPTGTMIRWLESQGSKFAGFLSFIRFNRLQNYLNSMDQSGNNDYTLFAPVDVSKLWTLAQRGDVSPESLLRYHMLRFPLLPIQVFDRVLRIPTMMSDQTMLVDGRDQMLSVRSGEEVINPNLPIMKINKVQQSKQTDNGMIYVIDEALLPHTLY
jgi:uncharacterized surface protein with fasciclin (FAS1) repeats